MKKQITILLCLLAILVGIMQLDTHPYREYSSKNCIIDENCVWDAFSRIAFGDEFDDSDSADYITKWHSNDPIGIRVLGKRKPDFLPLIDAYIKIINQNIGQKIRLWEIGFPMGIVVIFTDDFDKAIYNTYKKRLEELSFQIDKDKNSISKSYEEIKAVQNPACFARTNLNSKGDIGFAIVFIKDTHNKETIMDCIQEEITQSLGLMNDYVNARYTSFNDSSRPSQMTELDWLLLKILYHKDIKSGMKKYEVREIFPKIYQEIKDEKSRRK